MLHALAQHGSVAKLLHGVSAINKSVPISAQGITDGARLTLVRMCISEQRRKEVCRKIMTGFPYELDEEEDALNSITQLKWGAPCLDHVTLRERNPQLIYASITPYVQSGPKAQWPASDLTIEAAGGRLAIQGDQDRPPVPVGFPQASLHGGAQAAADIAIALNERTHSGLGQYLDLSLQAVSYTHLTLPTKA